MNHLSPSPSSPPSATEIGLPNWAENWTLTYTNYTIRLRSHVFNRNNSHIHHMQDAVQEGRALIIGAQGVLELTYRELAAAGLGRDPHRTQIRTSAAAGFRRLDLREPWSIWEAIADADIIINAVPDLSMTAERIVLREGGS